MTFTTTIYLVTYIYSINLVFKVFHIGATEHNLRQWVHIDEGYERNIRLFHVKKTDVRMLWYSTDIPFLLKTNQV
jgi:hypothetical protein